jgi:haloalkane dehalogenase
LRQLALGHGFRLCVVTPPFVRTPDERFETLPDWPFEPHYLDVDGLRVHYIDEGSRTAKPFLLVHGEPSWSYLYRHWVQPLVDAGFRVVAADHVGFGRSDKVTEDDWYVIDRHVEIQRALIEALDLRSIHLFCQDWGGPISLRNACAMPTRYSRLFISHTWLHHDGYTYSDRIRWWREASQDPAVLGGDMPTAVVVVESLRRDGHDKDALRVAYDAPYVGYESKAGARRFPWCLPFAEPEAGGADWQRRCYEELPTLQIPTHFVWGDADDVFPFDDAERWAEVVPGATLDRVPGSGHFIQEDATEDCLAIVLAHAAGDVD